MKWVKLCYLQMKWVKFSLGYKSGSIMTEVKLTFLVHRYVIIVSSVLTAVITYLAVLMEPGVSSNLPVQLKNFAVPKPVA